MQKISLLKSGFFVLGLEIAFSQNRMTDFILAVMFDCNQSAF